MGSGSYGLHLVTMFSDLSPWTAGDNSASATQRCLALCDQYDWCYAAQLTMRHIWSNPYCALTTDYATFTSSTPGHLPSVDWGAQTVLDSRQYSINCEGGSPGHQERCVTAQWDGGSVYEREGYFCYPKTSGLPLPAAAPPTPSPPRAAVINQWLAPVNGRLGQLCSSDDGSYELTYQKACGGDNRFIVIVTTTDGKVFGGYMPVSWKMAAETGGYSERRGNAAQQAESEAFLFTLDDASTKYECTVQNYCLYTTANNVGWGGGLDMYLHGNTGRSTSDVACARHSYGSWNANGDMCGSKQTAKVEVFAVEDSN